MTLGLFVIAFIMFFLGIIFCALSFEDESMTGFFIGIFAILVGVFITVCVYKYGKFEESPEYKQYEIRIQTERLEALKGEEK